MFNFTTLTVLNKVVVAEVDDIKQGSATPGYNIIKKSDAEKPELRIGNIRFTINNGVYDIIKAEKKIATPEHLSKATIDFDEVFTLITGEDQSNPKDTVDGVYRIVIYVGLTMNSLDSFYANSYVYKGKPFFVEFKVNPGEEAADAVRRAAAVAKKYMLLTADKEILKVSTDTTTTGTGNDTVTNAKLIIQATNGYQVIKTVVVQKFDPNAKTVDCCSSTGDFVDIMHGVPLAYTVNSSTGEYTVVSKVMDKDTGELRSLENNEFGIEQGLEAFCDYNWIMHNLRLPTAANTNFWSATAQQGEMPIVGGTYNQYIVTMCKDRDGIAGGVVGQRATSVTTHVFYVLNLGSNISNFETALKTVIPAAALVDSSDIAQSADTVLANPYHTT